MPAIFPSSVMYIPSGTLLPLANDHVIGSVPVNLSCASYSSLWIALDSLFVVILGLLYFSPVILMVTLFLAVPAEFVAITVKL